jgi:IclR family transcriptional regulator, acetate operon repressor
MERYSNFDEVQVGIFGGPTSMAITNVDRSLSLVEVLAAERAGLSLGKLALRLELPKSATHRLLQSLVERGYVMQDAASQDYALTLKLPVLGFRYLDVRRLPDVAQQALDRLAAACGEYCRLSVVEGERLAWIARAQGAPLGLRYEPPMGREVVLHATATGKAWLATLPERDALRIVSTRGFTTPKGFGKRALKSVGELRRQLEETRRRGYALAIDEGEPGTVAIAAAFRAYPDANAPAAGTVSVAGPLVRLTRERIAEIVPLLLRATDEVTQLWPMRARQRAGTGDGASRAA